MAIKINMNNNGNNNRIQDKIGAPALQIKFKITVHKIIYMSFTIKIKVILETSHE